MNKTLLAFPLLFAVGCGVSDDTLLNEIEEGLWEKICKKATADSVDETITCEDGTEIEVTAITAQQCVDANKAAWDAECTATFGDWRTCRDFDLDPCDPDLEGYAAACAPLNDCAM